MNHNKDNGFELHYLIKPDNTIICSNCVEDFHQNCRKKEMSLKLQNDFSRNLIKMKYKWPKKVEFLVGHITTFSGKIAEFLREAHQRIH